MPLDDQTKAEITELISASLKSLPTIVDEKLKTFMTSEIIPMVNGAKARTTTDFNTKLDEGLSKITTLIESTGERIVDPEKVIEQFVAKLAAEEEPPTDPKSKQAPKGIDVESLKAELLESLKGEYEGTITNLKNAMDTERDARIAAEKRQQEIEQDQAKSKRDADFVTALVNSKQIDPAAGRLAFKALADNGYIQESEDGQSWIVNGKDRYEQPATFAATDRLDDLLKSPEMQYFKPQRQGTGTATVTTQESTMQPVDGLKILSSSEKVSNDEMLKAMQSNPDQLFADLAALDAAG